MQTNHTAPLIGITTGRSSIPSRPNTFSLNEAYVLSIQNAGGIPIIIPTGFPSESYDLILSNLSGLVLSGGGDISPEQYNSSPDSRNNKTDQDRDRTEIYLTMQAIKNRLPLFGICRGIQILNVALGGTLFIDVKKDMPGGLKHDYYPFPEWPRDHYAHSVIIGEGSRLAAIFEKEELMTNSLHHQGIKALGDGLTPIAFAPDGLVEGVQLEKNPFGIAVQWHPECLPDDDNMQKLFKAFIYSAIEFGEIA
ncbi:MAG: gamma-glutamyl-gamma-aminobutyrate hydrolase family protein [Anaerolineaceae bacterium]|nr:gamma-glutamyl-gamma-aminobutyrate hydrolase family protein [Anaerolineaceae bacterium]